MKCPLARHGLIGCFLYLGLSCLAWAIPGQITVGGRLLDQSGNPVHYYKTISTPSGPRQVEITVNLASQVSFYDTATAATAYSTLATTATASGGYFSIKFIAPAAMLVKDSVWYSVAIDADQNGLTAADAFPDRFEIGSVPFALSAKPGQSFTTNNGMLGQVTNPGHGLNMMDVIPFETPEGGLSFNRMNVFLNSGKKGTAFSFGIYDDAGKRVAYSGLIALNGSYAYLTDAFLEVKLATVKLQPSKTYYVGFARSDAYSMSFPAGNLPAAPVMGTVALANSNGDVATTFDPTTIDPNIYIITTPVTLRLVDNAAAPKAQWRKTSPGGPEYRWILSKPRQ